MSKEGGYGFSGLTAGAPWAVGLVAVAALLTRAPAPATVSAPPTADAVAPAPVAEPPGRALGAVVPIVKLIADVANVRVTPPDVAHAWQVVERYLHDKGPNSRTYAAISSLGVLIRDGSEPARAVDTMSSEEAVALVAGFEAPARSDVEAQRKRLIDHVKNTRASADYVRLIRDEVNRVADVKFVVATIPDYVDSESKWIADEALASIQSAAGAALYALDRFLTPGWNTMNREADGRARRAHESEPGALIFKRRPLEYRPTDETSTRRMQLLVVLLVTETATKGLEKQAFAAAAQLVLTWQPAGPLTLRVLGPNFSGTSQSLRLGLEQVFRDAGPRATDRHLSFHVVTGSATSDSNQRLLEGWYEDKTNPAVPVRRPGPFDWDTAGMPVVFESAVHMDRQMLEIIEGRLDNMGIPPSQVALLVEDNTAWGSAVVGERDNKAGRCKNQEKGLFACALRLSFPMHISRLAARADSAASGDGAPTLALAEPHEPSDRLPTFTPALTENSKRLALESVLSTLVREQILAVGILATDKRDFVFLAREVIRATPNVQLFTTEPHILFLHPEYRSFVRGTLVASSYSLYPRTQLAAAGRRRQFVTMAAQGRYNGLLYLLARRDLLVDAIVDDNVTPDASRLRPAAVWLSTVGQDHFVPLDASRRSREPLLSSPYLILDGTWVAVRIVLVLVLLLHLVLVIAARYRLTPVLPAFFRPFVPSDDPDVAREQGILTAAAVTSISLLLAWFLMLGRAITADRGVAGAVIALPLTVAVALAGAVASAQLLSRGLRHVVDDWRVARRESIAKRQNWATVSTLLVSVIGLAVATYCTVLSFVMAGPEFIHAWRVFAGDLRPERADLQLAAERTLDVASFVSPTAPVLAFGLIGYIWALWSLRCLRHQTFRFGATAPLMLMLTRNDQTLADDISGALATTMHPTGRYFVLPLAALVLLIPGMLGTYSVDGQPFAYALVFGSGLALIGVTLEAAQGAWLGWRLKSTLERLRLHPIAEEITARGRDPLDWGISIEPKFGTARRILRDRLMEVRQQLERVPRAIVRPHVRQAVYHGVERRSEGSTNVPPPTSAPLPEGLAAFGQRAALRSNDLSWIEHWDHGVPDPDAREASSGEAVRVAESTRPLFETALWRVAVTASNQLAPVLWRHFWSAGRRPDTLTLADGYFRSGERFVSLMAALILRAAVARVVRGLSLALVLGGLLFVGHLLYTFPGRQFWLMTDLVALTAVAVIGALLLIALERDEVLSGLWSTRPGRIGIESGLVLRIAAYVAIPLLTLFATQFPEAAGDLTTWLEPVRQALPK
jgi:hypothetical protein